MRCKGHAAPCVDLQAAVHAARNAPATSFPATPLTAFPVARRLGGNDPLFRPLSRHILNLNYF